MKVDCNLCLSVSNKNKFLVGIVVSCLRDVQCTVNMIIDVVLANCRFLPLWYIYFVDQRVCEKIDNELRTGLGMGKFNVLCIYVSLAGHIGCSGYGFDVRT